MGYVPLNYFCHLGYFPLTNGFNPIIFKSHQHEDADRNNEQQTDLLDHLRRSDMNDVNQADITQDNSTPARRPSAKAQARANYNAIPKPSRRLTAPTKHAAIATLRQDAMKQSAAASLYSAEVRRLAVFPSADGIYNLSTPRWRQPLPKLQGWRLTTRAKHMKSLRRQACWLRLRVS